MRNKHKGFTLIELIIVIAIIAILATIVVVRVDGYITKAKNAAINETISQYVHALEMYAVDHGYYPDANAAGSYGPGEDASQSYCMGHCPENENSYSESSELIEALNPYIPGTPSPSKIEISLGGWETGGYYTCFDSNGNSNIQDPPVPPDYVPGECQTLQIVYALYGETNCGVSVVRYGHANGNTYCVVELRNDI